MGEKGKGEEREKEGKGERVGGGERQGEIWGSISISISMYLLFRNCNVSTVKCSFACQKCSPKTAPSSLGNSCYKVLLFRTAFDCA